jgi:signal transduction histidine kinase
MTLDPVGKVLAVDEKPVTKRGRCVERCESCKSATQEGSRSQYRLLKPFQRSSLAIDLRIAEDVGRLPSEMELLIFRLVQECMTNIHRHSGSKTALIQIEREGENVHVAVEDQGAGMSPQRLAEIQSHGTGVGIRGMRERVRQFRGDLIIESNGSGTRIYASLPLKTGFSSDQSKTREKVA